MHKTLIIPKGAGLQNQPFSRLANPTPAFPLFALASDPSGGVEITREAKLLFVRNEAWIAGTHVFRRRVTLLFVEGSAKVGTVGVVFVVGVGFWW